jgi:hypothetical protein
VFSSAACIASTVLPYAGTQQERSGRSRANRNRKNELVALAEGKVGSAKLQVHRNRRFIPPMEEDGFGASDQ